MFYGFKLWEREKMYMFSKDKTIISDVINRVLNCREKKELHVFGECGGFTTDCSHSR